MEKFQINHVSDTAIWIAAYRAMENLKDKPLFKDPLALKLIGEDGLKLAQRTQGSRYTAWSVVMRTYIIDQFIMELVKNKKINTVINLGAGLDTRPYRLELQHDFTWIEVDFINIIEHKNNILGNEIPKCQLQRRAIDLSNEDLRKDFFNQISMISDKILILTEGIIPYLTNEQTDSLVSSLYCYQNFKYWITEFYSNEILEYLRTPKRTKQMEHSPFLFYPDNWIEFFKKIGWIEKETKYFGVESIHLGRTPPTPGWLKENEKSMSIAQVNAVKYYLGYSIYFKNSEI